MQKRLGFLCLLLAGCSNRAIDNRGAPDAAVALDSAVSSADFGLPDLSHPDAAAACFGLNITECAANPVCKYWSHCGGIKGFCGLASERPALCRCALLVGEADCRADTDCVADYCEECSCAPAFVGCRTTAETPHACPALGCFSPQCCHKQSDCGSFLTCAPPGQSPGCGNFPPPPQDDCQMDSDCNGPHGGIQWNICVPPGLCDVGKHCVPGCASAGDCKEGESCGSDFRCAPSACNADGDCPADFKCSYVGESDCLVCNICTRRLCQTDSDCPQAASQNFCVDGQCYGSLGWCQPAPAPA